jgi:hypothetical protein
MCFFLVQSVVIKMCVQRLLVVQSILQRISKKKVRLSQFSTLPVTLKLVPCMANIKMCVQRLLVVVFQHYSKHESAYSQL